MEANLNIRKCVFFKFMENIIFNMVLKNDSFKNQVRIIFLTKNF